MRIARFVIDDEIDFGVVHDDEVEPINGHPFGEFISSGVRLPLDSVRLLAPVIPSKIVAVGRNYADHAAELGNDVPAEPLLFLKPSTAIVGPGESIVIPTGAGEVHHEGELAVVIGHLTRRVSVDKALDYVLGYTAANDVTARDQQRSDGQWTRAKGHDTFCPLGPYLATNVNPSHLAISVTVNGDVRQSGNTEDLIHDVAHLISYISHTMTLLPGDVILTGTPAGVGPIVAGDDVTVTIDGIGSLTNPVRSDG